MCKTYNPRGKGHAPPGWDSLAFKGITITWVLSLRIGLVLHSRIWVRNGPSLTFSFMKMSSSISELCEDLGVVAPPSMRPSLAAPESTTTGPCLLNKWEALAITHEVDNLSNSLSFITLTILLSVQVPITRGTCLENSDSSGTTRKTVSSSYPVILETCTHKVLQSQEVESSCHPIQPS